MAESSDDLVSSLINISETLREKAMTLDSSDSSRGNYNSEIINDVIAVATNFGGSSKEYEKEKSVDIKVQKDDIEVCFSSFFIFSLLLI